MPEPPATAPVPIAATAATVGSLVTVTFDQPLVPGPVAPGNWSGVANFTFGFTAFAPLAGATAAGSVVTFTANLGAIDIPPNRISYAAAPPDVVGFVGGLPAAAFVDFPLTIIP